jgi:uncharacterized membrane protein
MHFSRMHYFPISGLFLFIAFILIVLLVALIELRILRYAYERIGISRQHVYLLLFLTLAGSYINLPVYRLPPERVVSDKVVSVYGMNYVVPEVHDWPGTIIAVNLGGAVIPTLLSIYLLVRNRLYLRGLIGVAVVTIIVHLLARPVEGVGITVPTLVPPLAAAGIALLLSWQSAPPLAYISGSLGTLLGADLLNLGRVQGLGAPVASIGGAGTFDGIFVTGILAVLLAPGGNSAPEPEPSNPVPDRVA